MQNECEEKLNGVENIALPGCLGTAEVYYASVRAYGWKSFCKGDWPNHGD